MFLYPRDMKHAATTFTLLALGLILSACGAGTHATVSMDSTFASYVADYDASAALYKAPTASGRMSITFGENMDNTTEAGHCEPGTPVAAPYIIINKYLWDQMVESEKLTLIYHELGHCALHQEHRDHSIMAPVLLSGNEFLNDKDSYVQELFGH